MAKTHAKAASSTPAKGRGKGKGLGPGKDSKLLPPVPVFRGTSHHQSTEVKPTAAVAAETAQHTATTEETKTKTKAPAPGVNLNLGLFFKPKNKHACDACESGTDPSQTGKTDEAGAGTGTAGTGQQEQRNSPSDHEGSGGTGGTGGGGAGGANNSSNDDDFKIHSRLDFEVTEANISEAEAKDMSPNPKESEKKRAKLSAPHTWSDVEHHTGTGPNIPLSADYYDDSGSEQEHSSAQLTSEAKAATATTTPALGMASATEHAPMDDDKVEPAEKVQQGDSGCAG